MVTVRFSIMGVSKMRRGGGLMAPVVFSRYMKIGGTGVVGTVVTFGSMPVVFSVADRAGGAGVVVGTKVVFAPVPVGGVSMAAAETMPGITRRRMHTAAMISGNPEGMSRT
jgi:hypothetical protein